MRLIGSKWSISSSRIFVEDFYFLSLPQTFTQIWPNIPTQWCPTMGKVGVVSICSFFRTYKNIFKKIWFLGLNLLRVQFWKSKKKFSTTICGPIIEKVFPSCCNKRYYSVFCPSPTCRRCRTLPVTENSGVISNIISVCWHELWGSP